MKSFISFAREIIDGSYGVVQVFLKASKRCDYLLLIWWDGVVDLNIG